MAPIDPDAFAELLSELANSLQTCVGLSALVRRRLRSVICLGLLLGSGYGVKGVAAAEEVNVRVFDVNTGKPVRGVDVVLDFVQAEAVPSRPNVFNRKSSAPVNRNRVPTSTDGVARFTVPAASFNEIFLLMIYVNTPNYRWDSGYYPCGPTEDMLLQQVLKQGVTVTLTDTNCRYRFSSSPVRPDPSLVNIKATPGEVITFVRPRTWREWFECFVPFSSC